MEERYFYQKVRNETDCRCFQFPRKSKKKMEKPIVILPLFLMLLSTLTVTLSGCSEPLGFLPRATRTPDSIDIWILVPLTTSFLMSVLCFCAVIWAFALEAIALCRCIGFIWLSRFWTWRWTRATRGTGVTIYPRGIFSNITTFFFFFFFVVVL